MVRMLATALLGFTALLMATPTMAASVPPGAVRATSAAGALALLVDYRPYYHCHGPRRCHGKGNYYKYTPSDEPYVHNCRYGRGCGHNNGWNSPSSRYDYIGSRWGKHRHRHRHRHRH